MKNDKLRRKLIIVVPAYKVTFLAQMLESISRQTEKDFLVFIGDDASPFNLSNIVDEFKSRIDIVYRRFESNLGSVDLIAHWNRCIDALPDCQWIWLFSDDDAMDERCVELFYKKLELFPDNRLFHFDVQIIDEKNRPLYPIRHFPEKMTGAELFAGKIRRKIQSFAVEYIFHRDLYTQMGGFVPFDLAWCSDDATWIKFSSRQPIITIQAAKVYWRYSRINISSMVSDTQIANRKINASIEYLRWTDAFFSEEKLLNAPAAWEKAKWVIAMIASMSIATASKFRYVKTAISALHYSGFGAAAPAYLSYLLIRKQAGRFIRK